MRHLLHATRWMHKHTRWMRRAAMWIAHKLRFLRVLGVLNPLRYIKTLDWYIIRKFIGTYIYSIALIISISILLFIAIMGFGFTLKKKYRENDWL